MQTLKEVRKRRGVKQKAVAEHLGVSRQTYSRYENRQEKMSIEQAKSVCEFLRCDLADIFLPEEVS
ncbi:helix-turn-helix transcriptional regulator [Thermophilibacter sp.]